MRNVTRGTVPVSTDEAHRWERGQTVWLTHRLADESINAEGAKCNRPLQRAGKSSWDWSASVSLAMSAKRESEGATGTVALQSG
jgi:hypothetical protein